jgi:hypothetical protein
MGTDRTLMTTSLMRVAGRDMSVATIRSGECAVTVRTIVLFAVFQVGTLVVRIAY